MFLRSLRRRRAGNRRQFWRSAETVTFAQTGLVVDGGSVDRVARRRELLIDRDRAVAMGAAGRNGSRRGGVGLRWRS